MPLRVHPSDVRGAARLAVDATTGVTSLVEAVHGEVLGLPGLRNCLLHGPVDAVTGFVYQSIRGVTRAAGGGLDLLLGAVAPLAGDVPSSAARDGWVAALNGVIGDHLEATGNPLALRMRVWCGETALELEPGVVAAVEPPVTGKVMVLAHGLCLGRACWARGGQDRAAALARSLGYTPLHLEYNSGLHVSTNGRALADLLDALVGAWPAPVDEIAIVGHSMGGLVARSALHYGAAAAHPWRRLPLTLVFLGTPHHGAPYERHGHLLDQLLGRAPIAGAFGRLGRMRSAGITDLRHGNVLDEDWDGHCRFAHGHDTRRRLPLPRDVRCFAVAGSRGHGAVRAGARLVGDGLVPVASALGRHSTRARALAFPRSHRWVARGTSHFDLLADPAVFDRVARWLTRT
jgi:hypothetical protein